MSNENELREIREELNRIMEQLDIGIKLTLNLCRELALQAERQRDPQAEQIAALQARADFNRDHAAELFSDKLEYSNSMERWISRETGKPVLFTPYGWNEE